MRYAWSAEISLPVFFSTSLKVENRRKIKAVNVSMEATMRDVLESGVLGSG
jgi:hypothetical protein